MKVIYRYINKMKKRIAEKLFVLLRWIKIELLKGIKQIFQLIIKMDKIIKEIKNKNVLKIIITFILILGLIFIKINFIKQILFVSFLLWIVLLLIIYIKSVIDVIIVLFFIVFILICIDKLQKDCVLIGFSSLSESFKKNTGFTNEAFTNHIRDEIYKIIESNKKNLAMLEGEPVDEKNPSANSFEIDNRKSEPDINTKIITVNLPKKMEIDNKKSELDIYTKIITVNLSKKMEIDNKKSEPDMYIKPMGLSLNEVVNYFKKCGYLKNIFGYKFHNVDGDIIDIENNWNVTVRIDNEKYFNINYKGKETFFDCAEFIFKNIYQEDIAKSYYEMGLISVNHKKIEEAIKRYELAIKHKPDYAEAHNDLGGIYYNNDKLTKAIEEFKLAIQYKRDLASAYYNLGLLYDYKQNKTEEAIKEYKLAIKYKPNFVIAHNNLGVIYYKQGKLEEAIKEFKLAIKYKPDFAKAHNNLGASYGEQNKPVEAIKEFKLAIKHKSDFVKAHNNLATTYNNLGIKYDAQDKLEKAIKEYKLAIKYKPDFAEAYYNLGVAYKKQVKNKESIQSFEKGLESWEGNEAKKNEIKDIIKSLKESEENNKKGLNLDWKIKEKDNVGDIAY